MNTVSLSSLRPGMECRLQELRLYGDIRRRLQDLGLIEGAVICCAYAAPSGSPMAIRCKGTLLGLRKTDCDRILVSHNE